MSKPVTWIPLSDYAQGKIKYYQDRGGELYDLIDNGSGTFQVHDESLKAAINGDFNLQQLKWMVELLELKQETIKSLLH